MASARVRRWLAIAVAWAVSILVLTATGLVMRLLT